MNPGRILYRIFAAVLHSKGWIYALSVYKLSPQRVEALRDNASYFEYLEDDYEFIDFCNGATTLVAHNITFVLRHSGTLVTFDNHFCTMKENKRIVHSLNAKGNLKIQSL